MTSLFDTNIPDPTTVHDWPGALVAVVLIVCVLVVPGVLTYLNLKTQQKVHIGVKEVRSTLQENNGGHSIRDVVERIDKRLVAVENDVKTLKKNKE